jgi:NitT/TauT family transport system ATP-binding protein
MSLHSIDAAEAETPVKIAVREVSHAYKLRKPRDGKREFLALDSIDFGVGEGEFVAVVGPSGCGKSTLLDILSGLAAPTAGDIEIDGRPVTGPTLDRGIVLQGYALFPWRTTRQNIEFGLEAKGIPKAERREISDRFTRLVGLEGFEDRLPHELSGGMKQRVALARALAYDPGVLLMDEPFAAVDAQTREVLQDELLRIWSETRKTVILVTHSIEEAVYLADRVVVLSPNPGRIREIVRIDLPRPRTPDLRSSERFGRLRLRVWDLLQASFADPVAQ